MINAFIDAVQEAAKETKDKGGSDVPYFAEGVKPETVKDYETANKPFHQVSEQGSIEKIKTILEDMEGKRNDVGVLYERSTVELPDRTIEGVFPVFEPVAEATLPVDQYLSSNVRQFRTCNLEVAAQIERNPELAKKFTPEQLEQLKMGETPDGYTWHHHEQPGKMQLVDTQVHLASKHTGGRSLWGGGY
ncbi:HNH endonuclease [Paenibacillus oryzisoli]|uniref:HNH endonuclease n=1 Tax=Paenibacillus oryzisoli TaxID=1850517 RepID=UPI003D2AB724